MTAAGTRAPGAVVGLDVGGSKTHAVLTIDGVQTAEVLAGSANPSSVGVEEAGRQLASVFARLADGNPLPARVCAGVAGADTDESRAVFAGLLAKHVAGAEIAVVHDTALLLAAAGLDEGIALIAATGSVAWGRVAGGGGEAACEARVGGWGYLLGDEGSGYWVARAAVRHALELIDLGDGPDRLSQQLAADCGLQGAGELLGHFYATPERRYWASRSRVVFERAAAGDPAASVIVAGAADALVYLVARVAGRLAAVPSAAGTRPLPVVMAGGMAVNQPLLQRHVRDRLAGHGLHDVRVLDADPVQGAVALAAGTHLPSPIS
ncbi:N-acetylglucosamine kinase [Zhihengliuella halotolerans]|uniref:N-acetylglucosamine kinase-like BadF-type ATPase n=1 Tax=Zhihengliuella halotolerans TaxID=370736 RepID=A0A4Q8AF33_9MICC|nr:BadF/BadG/BcrA/BcrD ATPase family protein [Zhihengliuella halotolerans]RZU62814.1 N-acetylglucosamine kinase-like BadF-type ATPase [Zhihengliuella halotolerans]